MAMARRRRAEPLFRTTLLRAALLLAWASAGCATGGGLAAEDDVERQIRPIETTARLAVLVPPEGLATSVEAELSIAPKDPVELLVRGRRPGADADDGLSEGVVEFEVRWTDFEGTRPTSYGGSFRRVIPFGDDGTATRGQPLTRRFPFALTEPDERILARRVSIWARFHPVDMEAGAARTGSASMLFEQVDRMTLRHPTDVGLAALLAQADSEPGALFLAALDESVPEQTRLGQIVDALPALRGARRDELFGALQCLTGQTNGRNVYRWQTWWRQRQKAADGT
jgi:hypothetical protein